MKTLKTFEQFIFEADFPKDNFKVTVSMIDNILQKNGVKYNREDIRHFGEKNVIFEFPMGGDNLRVDAVNRKGEAIVFVKGWDKRVVKSEEELEQYIEEVIHELH